MKSQDKRIRFVSVIALLLVPILLLGWLFISQSRKDIAFAERERLGVAYLKIVVPLFDCCKTTERLPGANTGAAFLGERGNFDAVFASETLSDAVALTLVDPAADQAAMSDSVQALITRIGDQSNLILDPDLDSYYLMDAVLIRIPVILLAMQKLQSARDDGDEQGGDANAISTRILIEAVRLRDAVKSLNAAYAASLRASIPGGMTVELRERLETLSQKLNFFAHPDRMRLTEAADGAALKAELEEGLSALFQGAIIQLDALLVQRIEGFQSRLYGALGVVVAVAAAAVFLANGVFRTVLTTLDETIVFLADHDEMTKLKNRQAFSSIVDEAFLNVRKARFALHKADLDGFKAINDAYGHHVGDHLIKTMALRLVALAGADGSVGRSGGDEFVILQPDAQDPQSVNAYAERIIQQLHAPVSFDGHMIQLSASVGSAIAMTHGNDEPRLMQAADIALHASKLEGKDRACIFSIDMELAQKQRLSLERLVRSATEQKLFSLAYQPQYDVTGTKITCFEALLRLRNAHGDPVSPVLFIPVAEKLGLIRILETGSCSAPAPRLSPGLRMLFLPSTSLHCNCIEAMSST
nr:diguanylate cyclase [Pararhizobium antarcticum]